MSLIDTIKAKAKSRPLRIVLPEGDERRTAEAARIVKAEGIADPVPLTREMMSDPAFAPRIAACAEAIHELRRAKGLTEDGAMKLASDPMYFGMMMVRTGEADGLVSGAVHSTGDMLRPALQLVRTAPGVKLVSSCFLVEFPDPTVGSEGLVVLSDCVVNPNPDAESLAHITLSTIETARALCGLENPRVALLTHDAGCDMLDDPSAGKVRQAVQIVRSLSPKTNLAGALAFDDAVKAGANVCIFPDLQSGNICYKIAQRICGAKSFAVLQGLARPCNDLSRGCSVEDIVDTIAATVVQGQDWERTPILRQ